MKRLFLPGREEGEEEEVGWRREGLYLYLSAQDKHPSDSLMSAAKIRELDLGRSQSYGGPAETERTVKKRRGSSD